MDLATKKELEEELKKRTLTYDPKIYPIIITIIGRHFHFLALSKEFAVIHSEVKPTDKSFITEKDFAATFNGHRKIISKINRHLIQNYKEKGLPAPKPINPITLFKKDCTIKSKTASLLLNMNQMTLRRKTDEGLFKHKLGPDGKTRLFKLKDLLQIKRKPKGTHFPASSYPLIAYITPDKKFHYKCLGDGFKTIFTEEKRKATSQNSSYKLTKDDFIASFRAHYKMVDMVEKYLKEYFDNKNRPRPTPLDLSRLFYNDREIKVSEAASILEISTAKLRRTDRDLIPFRLKNGSNTRFYRFSEILKIKKTGFPNHL